MASNAKRFVMNHWFNGSEPSKAVTEILNWISNGKLTKSGRMNYKRLCNNLN